MGLREAIFKINQKASYRAQLTTVERKVLFQCRNVFIVGIEPNPDIG